MAVTDVLYLGEESDVAGIAANVIERRAERLSVDPAASYESAVDAAETRDFDCVVSDHDVFDEHGVALLQRVHDEQGTIPFVVFEDGGIEVIAADTPPESATGHVREGGGVDGQGLSAHRVADAARRAASTGSLADDATDSLSPDERIREYRTLFDVGPDGLFKLDAEGRMAYVNEAWASMVGVDRADLEGERFLDLVDDGPIPRDVVGEYLDQLGHLLSAATDREEGRIEVRATPPGADREHVYEAHVRLLPYEDTFEGCAVVVRDVTGREARRRELESVRQRIEFALRATNSVLWTIDIDTDELRTMGPAADLFGLDRSRLPAGAFFERAVHPDDREDAVRRYHRATNDDEGALEVEFRTAPVDGEVRWIQARARQQVGPEGRRLVGLSTDVTDRKRREEELANQNERLEEFTGIVSHDLRNPLDVARSRLALATDECDSEHLRHVETAHERMEALIDDLLTLARERTRATDEDATSLRAAAQACWNDLDAGAATLEVATDATVEADATSLERLLENLVSNAVEHGGDEVTVTVGDTEDGLYVADDGVGVPRADRDRLFEAGYSTADDGTGFGLRIVEQIADRHGWEVSVTDSRDGGTRFEITGVAFADR